MLLDKELIIGFALSYIANNIPTLKEKINKNKKLEDELENCYQKALKKWCKNDGIRKNMSMRLFRRLSDLKNYLQRKEHIDEYELTELWAEELRNNQICYEFIIEQKIDAVYDEVHYNNVLLQGLDKKTDEILRRSNQTVAMQPKRGLTKHKPVEGYIRRYCTDEQDGNNFLRYLLKNNERFTLADYVTGEIVKGKNKFIVYSGAQTGKTTELRNLCWELQECSLFMPVSYEVKSSHDLKQDDMPQTKWIDGKEVVVVIDALDEINGKEREDLLKTINSYAHDNPDMKMVLSCRSNYRRDDQLNAFHELYIESMSIEDVKVHINHKLNVRNTLWQMIGEQELVDFAKQPFFLNVLIDAYREKKVLPKDRADIYRLFIEKSYKKEKKEKGTLPSYSADSEEAIRMLQRVAVAMSLMNRQTLSEKEFAKCLDNDRQKIEECKRYSIIKFEDEDDTYSFVHNAFREWLSAKFLYNNGLGKAKQLASMPNGKIKPEWYNIIMLWMGMYDHNEKDKIRENIEWLKLASMELIIYADSSSLNQETKDNIFISILQEYKNLGIRMSNILADDYRDMLRFGQSNVTVDYIAEELKKAEAGTAYYADLMCLCYFLKWTVVENSSNNVFEKLLSVLDGITIRNLKEKPTGDLSYLYLGNVFFFHEKYVRRYFEIFKDSNNYDAIKVMVSLIHRAGMVDEYVDYILDKEHFVQNQHEGNTTHVVSRDEIYAALSAVENAEGIEKVLKHEFKNYLYYYDSEWSRYRDMIECLLQKTEKLIRKGMGMNLVKVIEDSYLKTFPDLYHYTSDHQDLLVIYRTFYKDTGIANSEKEIFDKTGRSILSDFDNKKEIERLFLKIGLWITKEYLDAYYNELDPKNDGDRIWAGWFRGCPYLEMANYAREKYNDFFPETEYDRKSRLRQRNHFDCLADYNVFKQQVLDMLDRTETDTRDGLRRILKEDDENPWNSYIYQFYNNYVGRDGRFSRDEIVKAIKNKTVYDAFFMMAVRNCTHMPMQASLIDDVARNRMNNTAMSIVVNMGKGIHCEWEYEEGALKLMLEGNFLVDEDTLIALIPFSELSVSREGDRGFSEAYTLFEYIEETVGPDKLGKHIVNLLRDINRWKDSAIGVRMAKHVIKNRISEGYQTVFEYITNGCKNDEYLTEEMIKAGIMVEEIKAASAKMENSLQLAVYATISRELGDERWVKEKLESQIHTFEGYEQKQALRILLGIGSIDALAFIVEHSELLDDYREYNFCFSDVNAATLLIQVIDICHQHKFNNDYANTSIITSLEKIAISNEESLKEVKRVIRGLISKDVYYKYLNRYLIQFENKYYESHSPIKSIEQVINMIDNDIPSEENSVKATNQAPVYISYNWENNSDHTVNHLCTVFVLRGINYCRDKQNCHYLDNIKAFMNSIRNGEIIVVVLSRAYMLSKNCMYELSGILERKDGIDRILPVVVDDSIRDRRFYIDMVKHWKEQKDKVADDVNTILSIDPDMVGPLAKEQEEINAIYGFLQKIKDYIDWVNAESLDNLSSSNFQSLIDKIQEKQRQ